MDQAKHSLQEQVLGFQQHGDPVEINVSASVLRHFLSGELRRGDMQVDRLQKDWVVQLGPFATHTIRLLKKSHMHPVMTLYVDNDVLVECMSSDIGGDPNVFRCKFRFVGERVMDFNVFEETKDGVPLDSKSVVSKPYQYCHIVEVIYPHKAIDNLAAASLRIDGVPFEQLPSMVIERKDACGLSMVRTALENQFPIVIPKKIVPEDTRGMVRQLAQNMVNQAGGWNAIGEQASNNLSVASSNIAKTMTEVGNGLSQVGVSAWEMMFPTAASTQAVTTAGGLGATTSSI
jgi:hypothetical protein